MKTQHQEKAEACGLHPNILAALQRQKVVPQDVTQFKPEDDAFLIKLAAIVGNKELLRMQLSRFTMQERTEIINADFDLKKWERYALTIFLKMYETGEVDSDEVLCRLYKHFGTKPTREIKKRIQQIRRMAAAKIARARERNRSDE